MSPTNPTSGRATWCTSTVGARLDRIQPPAIGIARAAGVMLWLTTAVPPSTVEKVADLRAAGEHAAESGDLRRVSDELAERGVNVGWEVLHHGDPVAGVIGFARSQGSSLIVASTHGDTGVAK